MDEELGEAVVVAVMKVQLIAHTVLTEKAFQMLSYEGADDADHLAEFAGRACYQSWDRPNPKTKSNKNYLGHIIEVGHESVMSHASATFYCTGISRALTHELVRHRWMSFSQLSQRYVDASDTEFVFPPLLDEIREEELPREIFDEMTDWDPNPPEVLPTVGEYLGGLFEDTKMSYEILMKILVHFGSKGKKVKEAARTILPNGTETKIVVSTNLRGWRDFLKQRLSPGADAEIRQFAEKILYELVRLAPSTFQDSEEWFK